MKKYIIHCTSLAGHHLEYIHHLYVGALTHSDDQYCFILPSSFHEKRKIYNWPQSDNIIIEDLKDIDSGVDEYGLIRKSFLKARNLGWYLSNEDVTDVILIDIISYLPFLPLFVSSKVRVHGILYRIYLYEWKYSSYIKRIEDVAKFLLFSRLSVFNRVFILNDLTAAIYLNKLYRTSKFTYLPDPIASLRGYNPQDVRSIYHIDVNKTIYLHPGGMLPYKGTIEILKAIDDMPVKALSNMAFIFAGRITPNIKNVFFDYYERLKKKVQIILIEGYIPFEDLADLFHSCDYVLIPYKVKSQSSGIVGHAAYYNKPVIVARGGIIGKVVQRWRLGCLLKEPLSDCIKDSLLNPRQCVINGVNYIDSHSVENFCDVIYQ